MTTKRLLGIVAFVACVAFTVGAWAQPSPTLVEQQKTIEALQREVTALKTCEKPWWRDLAIACIPPVISLVGVVWFLYRKPNDQARRKLAIELWQAFNTDEMQRARRVGWRFLNAKKADAKTQQQLDSYEEVDTRYNRVWLWALDAGNQTGLSNAKVREVQQTLRVFEFFAGCDASLTYGQVDPVMLESLLGHAFLRWYVSSIAPVIRFRPSNWQNLALQKRAPRWLRGMTKFAERAVPKNLRLTATEIIVPIADER